MPQDLIELVISRAQSLGPEGHHTQKCDIIRQLAKHLIPMGDEVFRALADPTRRKVLRMLGHGPMPAGDIAKTFEISAPSMSHHFGVLKTADLIRSERNGQQIVYSLNTTAVQDLLTILIDLFPPSNDTMEQTT